LTIYFSPNIINLTYQTGVVERLSNAMPEMTPVEPDPDNAGGGIYP